uniref:Uncharacterized protein n=1 Tax=Mycena chlorophos TaxID=658473 RepID=A0ABQ0KWP4_MYCCL|nr:predicted protein [Mycena chlorophos]
MATTPGPLASLVLIPVPSCSSHIPRFHGFVAPTVFMLILAMGCCMLLRAAATGGSDPASSNLDDRPEIDSQVDEDFKDKIILRGQPFTLEAKRSCELEDRVTEDEIFEDVGDEDDEESDAPEDRTGTSWAADATWKCAWGCCPYPRQSSITISTTYYEYNVLVSFSLPITMQLRSALFRVICVSYLPREADLQGLLEHHPKFLEKSVRYLCIDRQSPDRLPFYLIPRLLASCPLVVDLVLLHGYPLQQDLPYIAQMSRLRRLTCSAWSLFNNLHIVASPRWQDQLFPHVTHLELLESWRYLEVQHVPKWARLLRIFPALTHLSWMSPHTGSGAWMIVEAILERICPNLRLFVFVFAEDSEAAWPHRAGLATTTVQDPRLVGAVQTYPQRSGPPGVGAGNCWGEWEGSADGVMEDYWDRAERLLERKSEGIFPVSSLGRAVSEGGGSEVTQSARIGEANGLKNNHNEQYLSNTDPMRLPPVQQHGVQRLPPIQQLMEFAPTDYTFVPNGSGDDTEIELVSMGTRSPRLNELVTPRRSALGPPFTQSPGLFTQYMAVHSQDPFETPPHDYSLPTFPSAPVKPIPLVDSTDGQPVVNPIEYRSNSIESSIFHLPPLPSPPSSDDLPANPPKLDAMLREHHARVALGQTTVVAEANAKAGKATKGKGTGKSGKENTGRKKPHFNWTASKLTKAIKIVNAEQPFLAPFGKIIGCWTECHALFVAATGEDLSVTQFRSMMEMAVDWKRNPTDKANARVGAILGSGSGDAIAIGGPLEAMEMQAKAADKLSEDGKAKAKKKNDEDRAGGEAIRQASMQTLRKRVISLSSDDDEKPSAPKKAKAAASTSSIDIDTDIETDGEVSDDEKETKPKSKKAKSQRRSTLERSSSAQVNLVSLYEAETKRRAAHDESLLDTLKTFADSVRTGNELMRDWMMADAKKDNSA